MNVYTKTRRIRLPKVTTEFKANDNLISIYLGLCVVLFIISVMYRG